MRHVGLQSGTFDPATETKETDMENLTYKAYLENPEIRVQIDGEVRRARAEAVQQFIVVPVARMFSRMFQRAAEIAVRTSHVHARKA